MKNFTFKQALIAGATATALFASAPSYATFDLIPEDCALFAVHDGGLNDTQFLTLDLNGLVYTAEAFGKEHPKHDIESLDVSNDSILYAASGDNADGYPNGHLYRVDVNGDPNSVGDIIIDVQKKQGSQWVSWFETSGKEVSALAFRADGSLWGWAEECGLIEINENTGAAVLKYGEYPTVPVEDDAPYSFEDLCRPDSTIAPADYTSHVEDMTWDASGRILYIGHANAVLSYDPVWTGNVKTVIEYPEDKNVETVEMLPSGYILTCFHNTIPACRVVDPLAPFPLDFEFDLEVGHYNDIEGVAWSCDLSTQECWKYVTSESGVDGTGNGKIYDLDGEQIASGVGYEIYAMAMQQDGDDVMVVFNGRMPLFGQPNSRAYDGFIGFGDFVMTFGDKTFAVHFTPENDSGVTQLGLYEDVTLKNVTAANAGWSSLHSYAKTKRYATMGDIPLLKDMTKKPTKLSDYNDIIAAQFGQDGIFGNRKIGQSIQTGTKVEGDNFRLLYPEELEEMGFEFGPEAKGEYTFGFTFTKTPEMDGEFFAYLFTECINDGIAIQSSLPMEECVDVDSDDAIEIALNDNKDSTYGIELVSHQGEEWTYRVTELEGRDLSHWGLNIGCPGNIVSYTPTAGAETGPDGSISIPFDGIKWNTEESFSEGLFTIVMDADYPEVGVEAVAKAGNGFNTGIITGPGCN